MDIDASVENISKDTAEITVKIEIKMGANDEKNSICH